MPCHVPASAAKPKNSACLPAELENDVFRRAATMVAAMVELLNNDVFVLEITTLQSGLLYCSKFYMFSSKSAYDTT